MMSIVDARDVLSGMVQEYVEENESMTVQGIVEWIEAQNPTVVDDYVQHHRYSVLAAFVHRVLAGRKSKEARTAAKQAADDANSRGVNWAWETYAVNDDDYERRKVRDMHHPDLKFAAADQRTRKQHHAFVEELFLAIARRVKGDKKVSDVYSDEQLNAMYNNGGEQE